MVIKILRSVFGIHFAERLCIAGQVTPYKTIIIEINIYLKLNYMKLTRANPCTARTIDAIIGPDLAAVGNKNVAIVATKTPMPKTRCPPYFCANKPPGNSVIQ